MKRSLILLLVLTISLFFIACPGPVTYKLTVTFSNATVEADGVALTSGTAKEYADGTEVELEVTPATGYVFAGWSGDLSGTTNPVKVTMNADKTISVTINPEGGDTTPPTVLSVTPANSATDISLNANVVVTFSEEMDQTATASAFTLNDGTDDVDGAISWNTAGDTLTFNPTNDLTASTPYTVTVATTAADLAGNTLATEFTSTFTTGTTSDTTPPTVLGVVPNDAATDVALSATVVVTFSEEMDQTATASAFTLNDGTTDVVGAISWNVDGDVLTFTPDADLTASTTYTVTVATTAADLAGNTLATEFTSTFATGTSSLPVLPLDTWTLSTILTGNDSDWFAVNVTIGENYRLTTSDSYWTHPESPTTPAPNFDNEIGAYTDNTDPNSFYSYINLGTQPADGLKDISNATQYIEFTATTTPSYFRVVEFGSSVNPVTADSSSWVYIKHIPYFTVSEGTVTGGTIDSGLADYAEGGLVTITATATTTGEAPEFSTDVAVTNEVVTNTTGDTWTYKFDMPASDVEVSVAFAPPVLTSFVVVAPEYVYNDGTTFTVTVTAKDQFGNNIIPVSTESITITDDATATLGGTTTVTFSGSSANVAFTDLEFTGASDELGVTLTVTDDTTGLITGSTTLDIVTPTPDIDVLYDGSSVASGDSVALSGLDVTGVGTVYTFTITNLGNAYLTLTGTPPVQLQGGADARLAITAQPLSTNIFPNPAVPPTFKLTFTGDGTTNVATGTIEIPNDDPDENPYLIDITVTPETALFYDNFEDSDITDWTVTEDGDAGYTWNVGQIGTNLLGSSSKYIFINSDAAGSGHHVAGTIESQSIDISGGASTLTFKQYYRSYTGQSGKVEVWNGTSWDTLATYTTAQGGWTTPNAPLFDISSYTNADFKVRFVFDDGNTWGYYWAVDEVIVY
jgi:uncharacterized repeat protein (TIGR02543 family)